MAHADQNALGTPEADLTHVDTWVFDLDNTLYAASTRLFAQIDHRMTAFVSQHLSVDEMTAKRMQTELYHQYGTTLSGLMQSYHVDPHQFLAFVHDIDLTDLDHDPDLASILVDLPGRRLIYTNGSVKHAERITEKLGISHLFHGVHDIIAADYLPKPSHDAFARFMDSHGVTPGSAVFFDDMPHNLLPAHDLGLSTVWIDQTSDWSRPGGNGPHVHYRADCLKTFLRQARISRAENLQDQP